MLGGLQQVCPFLFMKRKKLFSMAKKKNKKQHKPASAVSTTDNTEKKRLERARRWAREYSKKIRASARDDLRFQDGLDYDEIRVKRRPSNSSQLSQKNRIFA